MGTDGFSTRLATWLPHASLAGSLTIYHAGHGAAKTCNALAFPSFPLAMVVFFFFFRLRKS